MNDHILDALDALARARDLNRMFLMASAENPSPDEKAIGALASVVESELEKAAGLLKPAQRGGQPEEMAT